MGLASSQARMLLLTARKSDLEYRAQAISQRKINIAMQTEQLATQYSRATSNRVMNFVYYTDGNTQDVMTEKLSYDGLMATNGKAVGDYLVQTVSGKYVVTGSDDKAKAESMYNVAMKLATADGTLNQFYERIPKKDKDGNVIKDAEGNVQYEMAEGSTEANPQYKTQLNISNLINAYSSRMQYVAEASNPDFFQSALRNGSFYLYKAEQITSVDEETGVDTVTTGYKSVSWSSLSCIQDSYNTEDDAAAQAEYEAKTLILSNQDKMLDLELNQIETQHKAIETEYDSVKKVIEKNIDTSYKIFA